MFLHRIHLNTRCREARHDLADPYQMHSTLCRAFSDGNQKCPEGQFLWRLEPETDTEGHPRVLVQSRSLPDWSRIEISGWFSKEPDPPVDIEKRLITNSLQAGRVFRFRLRANPCVTRNSKRLGLLQAEEQEAWIERKGREAMRLLPTPCLFIRTQRRTSQPLGREHLASTEASRDAAFRE